MSITGFCGGCVHLHSLFLKYQWKVIIYLKPNKHTDELSPFYCRWTFFQLTHLNKSHLFAHHHCNSMSPKIWSQPFLKGVKNITFLWRIWFYEQFKYTLTTISCHTSKNHLRNHFHKKVTVTGNFIIFTHYWWNCSLVWLTINCK